MFKIAEISFLSIDHTHEDVDRAFSKLLEVLERSDLLTLHYLNIDLRATDGEAADVTRFKNIGNWSGLCNREQLTQKISTFYHLCHFGFTFKEIDKPKQGDVSVSCQAKVYETDG